MLSECLECRGVGFKKGQTYILVQMLPRPHRKSGFIDVVIAELSLLVFQHDFMPLILILLALEMSVCTDVYDSHLKIVQNSLESLPD